MGIVKLFFGINKNIKLKLGSKDTKLYLGNNLIYPRELYDAVVTCNSTTYNGSLQAAQNIVVKINGETLIENQDYVVTQNNGGTNAGSYPVVVSGINYFASTASTTFVINKASGSVTTKPTAKSGLIYNGSAQALVNAGSGTGTMLYSLNNSTYSTNIPSGTNATSYTVYYKASASTNYNESTTGSVNVSIAKVTPTVTAPTAKSLTYNGSAQALVNAGSTNWGTLKYSLDNSTYSTNIPSGTNATSYTVYYKVDGDSNINSVAVQTIGVSIAKANTTYTAPTANNRTYDTTSKALLNAGAVTGGTMQYSSDNSNWSTTIPSGTNANTYTTYWRIVGDSNHNDKASASISTTISPKTVSSPTITLSQDSYVYSNTAYQPTPTVKDGSVTISSSEYTVSYSNNTNVGTATCTITDKTGGNYTVSGSKSFTITKVTPTVTAPTPKTLTFNNANQVLANAGSTNWGTIQYCLNNSGGTYSTTVPSASAANVTYKVWYKVVGNSNINDVAPASIDCMIAEKRVTTPTIVLDPTSYTYNGSARQPSVTVKDGSVVIPAAEYTTTYSNNTNAGNATVTITDNTAGNYYISGTTTFTINKASGSVTTAPTAKSLTYNAAAQQLVNAGSGTGTMMYKLDSGSWSTSIPTATNATSYTVYYKASASTNYNESASGSVSVTIAKVTPTVTAPTAKSLTYNGSAQQLANAGSTNWGTMQYSTASSGTYSASIPSGTSAGGYEVWYKVVGNSNVNDVAAAKITVNIAKANPSYTAPTAKSLTYNGSAQALLNAGSTSHGTIQYSSDNSSWSTTIPSQTNANTYTSYWRLVGDGNHNDVSSTSISTTIAKANGSVTINGVSLTYNGTARNLATVSNNTGTMHYKLGSGSWSTSIPTAANADSYTVYWYMDASTNYNGIASASSRYVSSSIGKADQSAPGITGATTTYPTTATATASGGGGQGSIEWESAQSQSSVGSHTTRARWSGNSNYNASPWSSYATVQMNKAAGSVTINGVSLTYNATARNLATVSNNTGTMHYSTNGTSWSTSIPTATNANSYTVYWYMDESTNYYGIASASSRYVSSTIGKADQSAPTATVTAATYPNTSTASASGGGGKGSIEWSNGSSRSAIGSQTTKARWSGNDNYNASPYSNEVTLSVAKFTPTVTLAATDRAYNGNALYATASVATPSGGKTMKGTIYYGTTSGAQTYSATYGGSGSVNLSSVSVTNVGSATVYAYFVPDSTCNDVYNNSGNASKKFTVSKANQSAPTATGATTTYHNTATATASGGGGQGTLTWTNGNTRTATGTTTTAAYWAGNSNYNASPNSNSVNLVVNKATDQSITVTTTNRTYNTSSQVVASATSHGCTYYLGFGSSSTSAPSSWGAANSSISQTNAGTYYVWYKGTADANHSADIGATYKGTVTIGKADQSAPTATGATTTYPTGATASASGGGGQGTLTWTNGSSRSSCGSQDTYAYWAGNSNYNASPNSNKVTITVNKGACPSYTAPTAKTGLVYNGSSQTLYNAGSSSNGTFSYSNGTRTAAGSQTVSWTFTPTDSCYYSASGSFSVTIAKATPVLSTSPTKASNWTYDGKSHALASGGAMKRSSSDSTAVAGTFSYGSATNAGSYTATWSFTPTDTTNYNSTNSNVGTVTVSKANPTYTAPTAKSGLVYSRGSQTLYNAGSNTTPGSFSYSNGTRTNAGSQTVSWSFTPTDTTNYNSGSSSFTGSIAKQTPVLSTSPTKASNWTYNGVAHNLLSGGAMKHSSSDATAVAGTFTYDQGTNVGTYSNPKWYFTPTDTTNYNSTTGTVTASIVCSCANPTYTAPTAKTGLVYSRGSQTLYNAGSNTTPGSFSYSNGTRTAAGSQTVSWTFTPSNSNYCTASGSFTGSIAKQTPVLSTSPTYVSNWTYDASAHNLLSGGVMKHSSSDSTAVAGTFTYDQGTNVGTYSNKYWYFAPTYTTNYNSTNGYITGSVTCNCKPCTAPKAKSLTWNGSAQALVNAGSTSYGTMVYSTDNSTWSTSIPSGTNATSYTVYWKVTGNTNVCCTASSSVACSIAKAAMRYTAPSAATRTYNGSAQQIVSGASATGGSIYYATSSAGASSSTTVPTQTNAGSYTVYWKAVPDGNHSGGTSSWAQISNCKIMAVVTATFNVTSTSTATRILGSINSISYVSIDGTMQPSVSTGTTFSTTGEHTVKYYLTDPTTIGDSTFSECTSLTSIDIPSSVTTIGNGAFRSCTSLISIDIPSGVTRISFIAFKDCTSLTSIDIPNSVTRIVDGAFQNCTSLTSIDIPSSVTRIGERAFGNCKSLTSCTIGSGVTSIGDNAFYDCSSLTSITSNAVTAPTINSMTFYNVHTGGTLYVPQGSSGYDTWMQNADYYLGLYGWNIDDGRVVAKFNVTSTSSQTLIGYNQYISGFSAIEIDGVAQPSVVSAYTFSTTGEHTVKYTLTDPIFIGDRAFYNCARLTSVTIPNSVTSIGTYVFYNCRSLTSIDIPSGVTSIGNSDFQNCSGLTSIDIPNSVTTIGKQAFWGCSGLTSCTIGSGVTSIGQEAFANCSKLTSIIIPNNVTSIGMVAFFGCSSLTSIVSNATTAPTIQSNTFQNVKTGGTLTVPSGSSGYNVWMGKGNYYLGKYGWTKVEQ